MANETNKNRDDRKDKVGNPGSGTSKDNMSGKAPLTGDVSGADVHTGDTPGIQKQNSGSRGANSIEDGGQDSGSSAGSH
ncbi:hypothetical protein [Rufibacter soli]